MREQIRALWLASRVAPVSRASPTKNPGCTEFEVDTWELSRFVLARLVPVVGVHPFPLNELMLMCAAICRLRPGVVFEWGTHKGKSARVFYECSRHYNISLEIHSVDLPDDAGHVEHPGGMRGELVRGLPNVHLHQGDGLDTALAVWRSTPTLAAPLFFVDGDHSYASVTREINAIATEIPQAHILLHDAFFQSAESGYNVGPHQAIEELRRTCRDRYRLMESGLGLPGMTLLYRPDR